MKYRLKYTDRSRKELELAVDWYEKNKTGLGIHFLDSLEESIAQVLLHPLLYNITHKSYHRKILDRFPFSLYYTIEQDIIVIHSIFDNKQDPKKLPS